MASGAIPWYTAPAGSASMGEVARAVQAHGGRCGRCDPRSLNQNGIVYEEADELIVTRRS